MGVSYDNPLALVRMLKGCPLSLVMAMVIARQPVGRAWLEGVTGYSQNVVQKGLAYLEEIGMAARNGRYEGWHLTDGAKALPLVYDFLDALENENESHLMTLVPSTTTTTCYSRVNSQEAAAETGESFNDSPSNNSSYALNLAALHDAGIKGKTAADLARLAHVTPRYIRSHAKFAEDRGDGTGLLVTRIRDGDPEPKHPKDCTCEDCEQSRRSRYITGEFAEFIQH